MYVFVVVVVVVVAVVVAFFVVVVIVVVVLLLLLCISYCYCFRRYAVVVLGGGDNRMRNYLPTKLFVSCLNRFTHFWDKI